jgi:AcrR family transcriptional regulator
MPELDGPQIARAGVAIVDAQGAAGLTMRAVADALGVSAMALYHYVDGKAALVGLVIDEALGDAPLPTPTGDGWREDLWALAEWLRAAQRRHPAVARLRRDHDVVPRPVLAFGERWLAVWQQSGLDLDRARDAALASMYAVTAMVEGEPWLLDFQLPDEQTLAWLPNLRGALTARRRIDDIFELLVRVVIDGTRARVAEAAAAAEGA